jgi:hypothetical protein
MIILHGQGFIETACSEKLGDLAEVAIVSDTGSALVCSDTARTPDCASFDLLYGNGFCINRLPEPESGYYSRMDIRDYS